MAAAVGKSEMLLEFGKIPVIDMHYFSQDEINTAAQSSDVFTFDDIVIPHIDYSTFNESSGSSKQTYSDPYTGSQRRAGLYSISRRRKLLNDYDKKEAQRIIELIQEFLTKGEHPCKNSSVLNIPPLNTEISMHSLPADQQNSSGEAGNCLQRIERAPALQNEDNTKLAKSTPDAGGNDARTNSGQDKLKKRIRTKEGARQKAFMDSNEAADKQIFLKIAGSNAEENTTSLTSASKKDGETDENRHSNNDRAAKEGVSAPANNVGTNIVSPIVSKEPFVPQLKRKFAPIGTESELQEFFNNIGGQWASKMKKRKIVDAEDFGEGFPKGWKLLLGVRKKHEKFLIECRKYISPDGLQFASCREVSTYLSNIDHSSAGEVAGKETSCLAGSSDDRQNALAEISAKENLMKAIQLTQAVQGGTIHTGSLNMGNNTEEQHSSEINNSAMPKMENPKTSQGNNSSRTLDASGNPKKRYTVSNQNSPMNCKKCNVVFSNRSTFMAHLTIHHVKKKKVVPDKTIADGVIMKNGKYECQICHKVFEEKNRYTGHVGVHARKNVKKPQNPMEQTSTETKEDLDGKETSGDTGNDVFVKENVERQVVALDQTDTESKANVDEKKTPDNKQDVKIKAEHSEEILEAKVSKEQNGAPTSFLELLGAEANGLASSSIGGFFGGLDSDSGKDQGKFNARNEKFSNIPDFGKFQMYASASKFSFEGSQDSNCDIGTPIELGLDGDDLQQVGVPPEQFGWDSFLSGRENNSSQFIVCIWCNTEFSQDGIDQDQQADSVGFICPICKTKISGQAEMDNELGKI